MTISGERHAGVSAHAVLHVGRAVAAGRHAQKSVRSRRSTASASFAFQLLTGTLPFGGSDANPFALGLMVPRRKSGKAIRHSPREEQCRRWMRSARSRWRRPYGTPRFRESLR